MREIAQENHQRQAVRALERQMRRLEETSRPSQRSWISSGVEPLDRLLPQQGHARSTLVEWLGPGGGGGASTLALLSARQACDRQRPLVVIDRRGSFYPPAAHRWGIAWCDMLLLRPGSPRDEIWAIDQVLRSTSVGAVLAWPEQLDGRTFRRLQLAAESGGALGLLVRDETVRGQPSWAEVRWQVSPCASTPEEHRHGWRLRVERLRCRTGSECGTSECTASERSVQNPHLQASRSIELEIDPQTGTVHEAHPLHVAAAVAGATPARSAAGA